MMKQFKLTLSNGKNIEVDENQTFYSIVQKYYCDNELPIVLAKIDGEVHELTHKIDKSGSFSVIDTSDKLGVMAYARTLEFVMVKAVLDLFPEAKITIEHSIHRGLTGEIHKDEPLNLDDVPEIEKRMRELIESDLPIKKVSVTKEEAIKIFTEYNMDDKVRLLKHVTSEKVKLYELDGRYDYFYGSMAYSTGILKIFKLDYYDPGFLLRFPLEQSPRSIKKFIDYKKLGKIFYETEQWGNILGVGDVGALNDKVVNNEIIDIIRISEALHEKKIAYIADMIHERQKTKVVLIAGPSSSGKTTFSKRLSIQLRVNGLNPVPISLDDYFVDREHTPKDENGDYDFESIYALDLKLFNKNLTELLNGEEVELPVYNFKTGSREWHGNKMKLPENGVLVIEGIHGLNEMLTSSISKDNKFKIYISALTQLNLDNHNRIATTDLRIIRRIVRDYLSRGYGGEATLKMWPSIRRGEEKNIFVFQEEADVIFNSALIYELCVLKKYALAEIGKIDKNSPVYYEALRLKSFLHFFKDVDAQLIPENSILREFIGGSCFYKY